MSSLQLFDALSPAIEDAVRASIRRFGVLVPVVHDQHGRIIDGHHRTRIAEELGVEYAIQVRTVADEDEAREIARTLNADRRHLTEEQRRPVVAELRQMGHSVRAIAGALGVSVGTAHKDIAQVFSDEHLPKPDRVTGSDGKSYASARPAPVAPEPDAIDDVPLWGEPEPEAVHTMDTPAAPELTPEQRQANAEFRQAVRESAERQQQEVLELMAEQRARNAFEEAGRSLLSALSWAAAFKPPADAQAERVGKFVEHAERLVEIVHTWREQTS